MPTWMEWYISKVSIISVIGTKKHTLLQYFTFLHPVQALISISPPSITHPDHKKQLWQLSANLGKSSSPIKGRGLSSIVEPAGMSLVAKSPFPEVGDGRTSTWHSGVGGVVLEDGCGTSWDVMFGPQVDTVCIESRCCLWLAHATKLRALKSELFQAFTTS